jgi:hypothetical protein
MNLGVPSDAIRITEKSCNTSLQKNCTLQKALCFSQYTETYCTFNELYCKGTVPQDFRLQIFSISFPQSPPLVPYMMFSKPREDTTHQFTNDTGRKLTKTIIDTGGNLTSGVIDTDNRQLSTIVRYPSL